MEERAGNTEKEQEAQEALRKRIQQLEKLTALPTAPLRHQMTSLGIGNQMLTPTQQPQQSTPNSINLNPFTSSTGGHGNLFQTAQIKPTSQNSNPRPPATQADRATLLVCIQKYPHHPDTEAGRQAQQAQQADWARTHGSNVFVTELTPYPLRPGTLPVGSGECFTCSLPGHMGRRDSSTCRGNCALHPHKQTWRSICSRILRQTRVPANIQLVTVDDYGTTWQEVQRNGEGLSN